MGEQQHHSYKCSSMMKEKSTSNHRKRDDPHHNTSTLYPYGYNTKDKSMKINLTSPSSSPSSSPPSSSSLKPSPSPCSYSSSLSSPSHTLFNIIICMMIIQISYDLVTWIDGSLTYMVSSSSSLSSSPSSPTSSLGPWLSFLGAEGFVLYNGGFGDPKPPPSSYSSSDSWVSEELWPKEKSLIHIKLIKPLPKEIPIWELRNKDNYLSDLSLDFDSPYRTMFVNNCVISFKSYYDGYSMEPNNQEIVRFAANIQVQIGGGLKCKKLPLSVLTPLAMNLTHLVVRDTGINSVDKFLFGANRLDKLIRLDLIGNRRLETIQARAFDGLPRLNYLSIMNNRKISDLALETFAGLKNLEELIYIGNDDYWDQAYFSNLLLAVSDKILPNLIHLHLCGSSVNDESDNHQNHDHDSSRIISTATSNSTSTIVNSDEIIDGDDESETNKQEIDQKDGKSSVISDSVQVNNPNRDNNNNNNNNSKSGIKINKNDFNGLTQIKYLQLSDCDINYIHPSAMIPLIRNIVGLNLGGNTKLSIDNLKSVLSVFYMNNLKFYRQEAERITANSTFLLQRNNPVKIGLDKLDLSYTINTPSVPKDLLTVISKTSITELYLKKVSWKYLREGDIPPMPNLRVLHIDHSQIEEIDEKAFSGLEELVKLSLRGNYIKEIPLFLLEPLRKLEYLDLSGFRAPPASEQSKLIPTSSTPNPDEEEEEYDADAVLEIPRKAFVHGTHLKEVNLSYKNLQQLPRYLFIGLFKLEKLHLRGCNLKYIEYLTFFPLKSIVYIDLSENVELISNVRQSEEDTFVGLEAVEMIRLSDCNLTSDDINDFNVFRRMHEHVHLLDLSRNHIDSIQSTTLQNFSELRHIDLSHNHIRSWQNYTIFSKNSFITTLDISHNQITHITPEMLGDFRNLKNLSFALNPLQCECDWEGPLLLLDQKQKKGGGHHLHHQRIQDHIEQLVHRQQEIVSTAFASSQAPPKSIIEWLNTTTIHFLRDRHPLRSDRYYFCHPSQLQQQQSSSTSPPIVFKEFFRHDCPNYLALRGAKVSAAVLALVTCALLLSAVFLLVIAFIYNSTIRKLLTMVDDDFLHNYQYDAFVSYNVNDSDWVFNKLLPNLEELPAESPVNTSHNNNNNNNNNQHQQQPSKGQDGGHPNCANRSHIKLCVYDRDFIAGRPISECITESIKNSRKVILVISNNFARSPWCRFETDLAHSTLMDQNREGLILIKLEEMSGEIVEKIAPQIHFLLKTRIYLSWSSDQREQDIFWRKLRRALGFTKSYGTVKQYYKNYVGALYKDRRQSVSPNSAKDDDIRVSFRKSHDTNCDNKSKCYDSITKIDPECGNSVQCPSDTSDSMSKQIAIETPASMSKQLDSCDTDNVISKHQPHDFRVNIDCDQPTGMRKESVQKVSDSNPMPSAVKPNSDHHHHHHQHHHHHYQNGPQGSPNDLPKSSPDSLNETSPCESGGTSLTASNSNNNNHHPSWSSDVIRKDGEEVVVVVTGGQEVHEVVQEEEEEEVQEEKEEEELQEEEEKGLKDIIVDSENNLSSQEACTKCLREQLDDLQTGTILVDKCRNAGLKEISNRIGTTCDRHHNVVSIFDVSKKNSAIMMENECKKRDNDESIVDTFKQNLSSNDNHRNGLHLSSDIELRKCGRVREEERRSDKKNKKDVTKLEDVDVDEESDLDDDHHHEIITDSVSYNHDSGVCCYKKKEVKANYRNGRNKNVFTIEFDCEQDDADDENLDETDQESTSGISINDTGIHDCGPHCRSLESATDDSDSHRNISSTRIHNQHRECRQNHHHGCFNNHHRQLDYRSSSSASISPRSLSRSRLARSIDTSSSMDRSQLPSQQPMDGNNVQNCRDARFASGSVNMRQKRRRRTRGRTKRSQSRVR
ncbi:uncharacterized protein LOC141856348 isoform X2 [Brevipalpus obovatus]|uniref:uncharacterized protein LOC141856348 isoform X2 n=1 Tax=Brevipalpus obovatus TaxID=246614 RepID=UPI003D9E4459